MTPAFIILNLAVSILVIIVLSWVMIAVFRMVHRFAGELGAELDHPGQLQPGQQQREHERIAA